MDLSWDAGTRQQDLEKIQNGESVALLAIRGVKRHLGLEKIYLLLSRGRDAYRANLVVTSVR